MLLVGGDVRRAHIRGLCVCSGATRAMLGKTSRPNSAIHGGLRQSLAALSRARFLTHDRLDIGRPLALSTWNRRHLPLVSRSTRPSTVHLVVVGTADRHALLAANVGFIDPRPRPAVLSERSKARPSRIAFHGCDCDRKPCGLDGQAKGVRGQLVRADTLLASGDPDASP